MAPQLSIIFPSYQRPDDVHQTVALLRQNVDVSYELFIVDNSPQPLTLATRAHEHYVFMGSNAGTAARYLGIARAAAPYILMLDDDSHPLPGSIAASIATLEAEPADVAGLTGCITRPDNSYETSLLPTVLLGCGVLFRTAALRRIPGGYPQDFCFYGEEYWLTLALYRLNMRLQHCPQLRVEHRLTPTARSLERVFYYLGRNNAIIWEQFAPPQVKTQVLADTFRRYELTAGKEGVLEALQRGRAQKLQLTAAPTPLSMLQFRAFTLLDHLESSYRQLPPAPRLLLLGSGKFPSFWAAQLQQLFGLEQVLLADFNPGLHGQHFAQFPVLTPAQALAQLRRGNLNMLCGHTALADSLRWQQWAAAENISFANFGVLPTWSMHLRAATAQA